MDPAAVGPTPPPPFEEEGLPEEDHEMGGAIDQGDEEQTLPEDSDAAPPQPDTISKSVRI